MLIINSYLKGKISVVVKDQMSVTFPLYIHIHKNIHEIISFNGLYSLINLNFKNSFLLIFLVY